MKKLHFSRAQMLVLLGASLFQCALIGILVNSASILLAAIQQENNLPMSMISIHSTLRNVAAALLGPILVRWFHKLRKPAYLFGCVFFIVAGHLLLTIDTPLWVWYIIPFFFASSLSVGVVAVPYLLAPWFPKQIGFATGFAMAFSGLGGALFNPVAARLIEAYGYRCAIWVLSAVTLVLTAFSLALIFRQKAPAMQKQEETESKKNASSARLPVKNALCFTLCELSMLGTAVGIALVTYLSMYARSLGYSLRFAANMMSCVMVGNILGKLIFGFMSDRIGTWLTMVFQSLLVAGGLFILIAAPNVPILLLAAASLFGTTYVGSTIAVSKCTMAAYGAQECRRWDGFHTSFNSAATALLSLGVGFVYDRVGLFQPSFLFVGVCSVVSAGAALVCCKLSKKTNQS